MLHDDKIQGHAALSTELRALPNFNHRRYIETLTSPSARAVEHPHLLWSRKKT
jgi:hypothetical protein